MKIKYFCITMFSLAFLLILATTAQAAGSGAFRIFGVNAEAAGKGYAFTGEADNASAVFYNPAGITQLNDAKFHSSVGFTAIQAQVEHESLTGTVSQMQRETFFVPNVYIAGNFGLSDSYGFLDRLYFGVGSTSNWGLSTEWNDDSFARYKATKTELENIENTLVLAYQLTDKLSIAGGGIFESSKVTKDKAVSQLTGADAAAQLKGEDKSWGYTVSTLYKANDQHQFGLHYRSEIELNYEGHVLLTGLDTTAIPAFGGLSYQTIFGGSNYTTDATSKLTLPQSVAFGYSYTPNYRWRFNFDVEWMDWSSVENEIVHFPTESGSPFSATRIQVLEASANSTHDWRSAMSYGVGAEYIHSDELRLRIGYFYNETPIGNTNFDGTIPDNYVHGINLGFGYTLDENSTVDVAWTTMLYEDREVNNDVGNAAGADLDGTFTNILNLALVTYNYAFH